MRTAIPLRNVVGKAQNAFVVRVIPLHRDFNRDIVFLANGVKHFRVQHGFAAVDVLHKTRNTSAEREIFLFVGA